MNKILSYKSWLSEATQKKFDDESEGKEVAETLEKELKKLFPNSFISIKFTTNLMDSVVGTFAIGKDKNEYSNGIMNNDPLFHKFLIYQSSNSKFKLEWLQGNLWAGSKIVKTGIRNKTGTKEQVIKAVTQYFKKLPDIVEKNKDIFNDEQTELLKKKKALK